MYARVFIILALLTVVSKAKADAVLRGVVLSNELGGPPIGNVEVSAVGANPNNTDASGSFTFTFPSKKPGETVRLIVRKQGYVVVNEIQLEVTLPADPQERPAILLLCKEGDREEMARRFYRLKLVAGADETYKKEAQHADPAELGKLQQERDQAKKAADKRAEEFAKQEPGVGSELYRKAMRLFLDGKVDEALVTLSDEKLRELSKAAKERKAEAGKTTEAIQAWLLKAQLFTVQFRFDDAEKAYQEAIDTSPESLKANFAFAHFNQELNRYDKARRAYARCLELARSKDDDGDIALTLNNLANLDKDQNRPETARKGYEEALKIYRELAQKNRDIYLPKVAMTLNNLAMLDKDQNRMEAARKGYEEALRIYREFAQKNPDTYLSYVATILNNLAVLHADQNRMERARKEYEEALKIRRELAQKNADTYLPDVAGTLNNLGLLGAAQDRPEAARTEYEEALKIYREFAQKNPDTYLPYVATILNNLANLDSEQNRMEAARKEYEEALRIRGELAQKNPDTYLPDVAQTLYNLANLDGAQKRPEAARKKYEEALKIRRELAQKNPDTYLSDVAKTLGNLASVDVFENRIGTARKRFEEALDIFEQLAARNPDRFQSDIAKVKRELQTLNR